MALLLILSLMACSANVVYAVILAVGMRKMTKLGDTTVGDSSAAPQVSIVVPACNEEDNIENSLLSLLAQEYKNLEIIVVNDRSTDHTGEVLDRLQARFARLVIHQITELPAGWMGKSHALASGAALARGEYLVFTDADVVLEKTTIARAVAYMTNHRLDHLTLLFKNLTRGWLLNCLILEAGMGLLCLFRPWLARRRDQPSFVGIGAFNMVKRSVYREIGGHERIRMHPVDDMMLGKLIKEQGFFQDCLQAYDFVAIPWYDSVGAMVSGLEKNMFALLHYRLTLVPLLLLAIAVATILPVWAAMLAGGAVQAICLITVGIRLLAFYRGLRMQGLPGWYLPGVLLTPYLSCYIVARSALITMKNGGIIWRGQHYSLAELKKTTPFLF